MRSPSRLLVPLPAFVAWLGALAWLASMAMLWNGETDEVGGRLGLAVPIAWVGLLALLGAGATWAQRGWSTAYVAVAVTIAILTWLLPHQLTSLDTVHGPGPAVAAIGAGVALLGAGLRWLDGAKRVTAVT